MHKIELYHSKQQYILYSDILTKYIKYILRLEETWFIYLIITHIFNKNFAK